MERTGPRESELSRDLSLFHITMLGVGMMIGAGVFVLTGIGIGVSGGGGILIAFALNGLIALTCTMAYAELASAMPEAGGGYSFVREGLGGSTAFLSGWMSWFGHAVAGSLYAITFSKYAIHFFEALGLFSLGGSTLLVEKGLAVIIALVFIYINYRGASETGTAGSAIAVGQMIVLGIIGIAGVWVAFQNPARLANFSNFLPHGWGKVLVTMGLVYIGFEGYEVIAQAGEEVENPRSNIPKAIFYALIAVVTIYLLAAFAAVVGAKTSGMPIWEWFGKYGATGFAKAIGPLLPMGGLMVTLAAIFSSTSALNATTYSSTRVSYALGRDGYLPEALSRISKSRKIPSIALLLSGIIIVIVAVALPVEGVAASADIMFMLLFLFVNLSVIRIRQEKGRILDYGYMIPLFPLIPIISIISHVILAIWLFDMGLLAWITTALWVGSGAVIYKAYSEGKSPPEGKRKKIISEERALREKEYQILVPVANPKNASMLMEYAIVLARERDAEILVLNMVTVPEQTPLSEVEQFVSEGKEAISKAMEKAPEDIPVHSTIRYGHDVARGIISAVKEHDTDLLIMGCGSELDERGCSLGRKVDPVIEKSLCDSIVIKPEISEGLKENVEILCPIARGSHSLEVVKLACTFAGMHDGKVTLYHILGEDETEKEAEEYARALLPESPPPVSIKVQKLDNGKIAESIVQEAENYDLVMMGATERGWFETLIFGTIPEKVAKTSDKTVLLVKKFQGAKSWVRRWLGT